MHRDLSLPVAFVSLVAAVAIFAAYGGNDAASATLAPSADFALSDSVGVLFDNSLSQPVAAVNNHGAASSDVIQTAGIVPDLTIASVRTITAAAAASVDRPLGTTVDH